MRKKVVGYAVLLLIKKGIVNESDKELYEFGVNQLLLFFINLGTSLIIGIVLGMVWQSIVFSIAYIPLRRFAGGYHAATAGACYLMSTVLIAASLMVMKYLLVDIVTVIAVLLIAAIIVWFRAPVASINKPLTEKEFSVFKRKTRVILIIECVLTLSLAMIFENAAECISIAVFCSGLMLIVPTKK